MMLPRLVIPDAYITLRRPDGTVLAQSEEAMLAQLLLDYAVHLNNGVFDPDGDEQMRSVMCFVVCSDVFADGAVDDEPVLWSEIADLYAHHMRSFAWGTVVWCVKKRKMRPTASVVAAMKKDGIWAREGLETLNLV